MNALNQIKDYIDQLDKKYFQRYVIIAGSLVLIISSLILYRYYRNIFFYKKKIETINHKRKEVKDILERFEMVKIQQTEVDNLLEKDKDFKIGGYFNEVITKIGIAQNKTREPETSSEELDNGYTERKLYASFSNITMQKLTELLDTIEQNERIYTKEVEMYKPDTGRTINVNLLIATLEPKIETTELAE
jgi:hypothetical protein